jgi:ABC-type phosphate transport system substrate-binding protein
VKKLLSSAVAIASVIGVCALPSQVSAGADSSSGDILGIAGSDTTTFVMEALSAAHNTNSRYNPNKDRAVNIPPLLAANPSVEAGEQALTTAALAANKAWLAAARSTWPGGIVLPADNDCKVNLVFGGYGSRDLNTDADTGDGAVGTPLTWEGATIATADLDADTVTGEVGETWYLGLVPPNGSSSGRSAVEGGSQNGLFYNGASGPGGTAGSACIDIARSSSRSTSAKLEGWAFALDAIDWTYFAGNTHGVATSGLTKTQLGNIYTCYAGTGNNTILNGGLDANADGDLNDVGDRKRGYPTFRFWGDVNGNATDTTPIAAYRVQVGSGTGSDVATTLIGKVSAGSNAGQGANDDPQFLANCDSSGNNTDGDALTSFSFPQVQEHDCRGVSDANKFDAICFYGYSRWVIQAKALETDKRNGAVFGKFGDARELKRPSFSSINETGSRFEGTRLVYNYVGLSSTTGSIYPRIEDSRRFVGVTAQPTACNTNATGPVGNQVVSEVTAATDCNFDGDSTDAVVAVGGVPGFICGDLTARKIIATYGLKPLPMAATDPNNGALGTSYCRLNKAL